MLPVPNRPEYRVTVNQKQCPYCICLGCMYVHDGSVWNFSTQVADTAVVKG